MTRLNGTMSYGGPDTLKRVTAVHRQGGEWRVLTVERQGNGPRVVDHRTAGASTPEALGRALEELKPDRVVWVLPGASAVSRVFAVPAMEEGALASALQLQAEAELPPSLPAHRRGAAALNWDVGGAEREAVAVGWPGEAPTIPSGLGDEIDVVFAPESACLIELASLSDEPGVLLYADRDARSVELVMREPGRTTVRSSRLPGRDWMAEVKRFVAETGRRPGAAVRSIELPAASRALVAPSSVAAELRRRLSAPTDAEWWTKFGIAAAAALATFGPRRALVELLSEAPAAPTGLWYRLANSLAEPRRAFWISVACIVALLMLPLLGVWGQYQILKAKAPDDRMEEVAELVSTHRAEADFFRLLNAERWPMTKLLRDIAGAVPPGIRLDEVNLTQGKELIIRGRVGEIGEEYQAVLNFQGALSATGIFNATLDSISQPTDQVQFEIRAQVLNPLQASPPAFDYASEPLRVMLYGEEARDLPVNRYAMNTSGVSRRPTTERRTSTPASGGGRSGAGLASESNEPAPSPPADPDEIPEPLTAERIAQLSKAEAIEAANRRAGLMMRPSLDKAVRDRLRQEWLRLVAHQRQIKDE